MTEPIKQLDTTKADAPVPPDTTTTTTPVTKQDKSPEVKPVTHLSEQTKEQIERNAKANAALNNKKIEFSADDIENAHLLDFRNRSEQVMTILKNHGMDTQQAEKAHKLLMEL